MPDTLLSIYERTLKNCKLYEKENKHVSLVNEIGVLRGIAYCMEIVDRCPINEEFLYYINLQEKYKKGDDTLKSN